jgi:hypothetical protein
MHGLLLDENITHVVASQVTIRRPDINIQSLFHWHGGSLTGTPDPILLQAATEEGLTVVTYDVSTIMPLTATWGETGQSHAGVIFIDEWTIHSYDIGSLVRALEKLWDGERENDWTNRTHFLDRP